MNRYSEYQAKYLKELNENVVAFWLKNGQDKEYGGVITCVDQKGTEYCTDKSVWFQGRCAWVFSNLCNTYGYNEEYKAFAKSCIDFAENYCTDKEDGRMYFSVTKEGTPLRKRRYIFSETFYIIACAEYATAFDSPEHLEKARKYYDFVMDIYRDRENDPFKITPKTVPGSRPSRAYSEPMILLNVTHTMLRNDKDNTAKYNEIAKQLTDEIFKYFYKPELKALLEMTGPNGEFLKDAYGGRTMSPGHTIEGVWFLINQAQNTGDMSVLEKAENMYTWAMERGWDYENGGLLAFTDVLGFPPEALEHDMKLWWPTCETIISSLMLFEATGKEKYWNDFVMADKYAFEHFSDPQGGGEWFGYLRKDGTPTMPACKGNLFKGPFHIPRMLIMAEQILGRLAIK